MKTRSKNRQQSKQVEKVRKKVLERHPSLKQGFNLVKTEKSYPALQVLLSKELEDTDSNAVWIDSGNESSTYALSAASKKPGIMDKVKIGRAFTPFQHHSLIHELEKFIDQKTRVLVLPNPELLYTDGQINRFESLELFKEAWGKIVEIQEKQGLKVLVSQIGEISEHTTILENYADQHIKIENTDSGRKYDSEDFENLFYREKGLIQTTIPFWEKPVRGEIYG